MMAPAATTQAQRRSAARIAGLAGPISFVAIALVSFNIFFPLNEATTAAEAARRVLADERLFRIGIAGYLLNAVAIVVQVAALYVVLEPAGRTRALFAALARLVSAFAWVVVVLNLLTALDLMHAGQLDLARVYLRGTNTYYVGLLFWSLAAAVGCWLWLTSNYVPRALSAIGLIASVWCVFCTCVSYVFPSFIEVTNWWFDTPMVLFELVLGGWLLFRGLPNPASAFPGGR